MIDRTVQRAPDNVEQALLPGKFRDTALEFLVIHRLQAKDVNRALELFMLIESDTAMTVPARELLTAFRVIANPIATDCLANSFGRIKRPVIVRWAPVRLRRSALWWSTFGAI